MSTATSIEPAPDPGKDRIPVRAYAAGFAGSSAELCAEALCRGHQRLMTSWDQGERGPENFYLRLGFQLTGEKLDNEVVGVRQLA